MRQARVVCIALAVAQLVVGGCATTEEQKRPRTRLFWGPVRARELTAITMGRAETLRLVKSCCEEGVADYSPELSSDDSSILLTLSKDFTYEPSFLKPYNPPPKTLILSTKLITSKKDKNVQGRVLRLTGVGYSASKHLAHIRKQITDQLVRDPAMQSKTIRLKEFDEVPESFRYPAGVEVDPFVPSKEKEEIAVWDLDFEEALQLAGSVGGRVLPHATLKVSHERGLVIAVEDVSHRRNVVIEPKLVIWTGGEESGVLFRLSRITTRGYYSPDYSLRKAFDSAMREALRNRGTTAKYLPQYRISPDKGTAETVSASVPTTYEGFKKYLDDKKDLHSFEGIWTTANRHYVLGFIRASGDARFKYYGFVIDSKDGNWRPGEIKVKFSDIRNGRVATSDFLLQNKAKIGLAWKTEGKELLASVNAIDNLNVALIKTYPTAAGEDFVAGSGTGWAVTKDGVFVTCAHVIEDASKIRVGFKNDAKLARVLIVDKKLDIALIKLQDSGIKTTPMPLASSAVKQGTKLTALGYPLASVLGSDIRVSNGLISSASGIGESDVTRYQISVPINPGHSGCPIIDAMGRVVAMGVAKLRDSASADNDVEVVNFAVKSPYIKILCDQVRLTIPAVKASKALDPKAIHEKYKDSVLPIWVE